MKESFLKVAALLLTVITVTLTGCSIWDKTDSEEYKSPGNLAKERQAEIMACFINKDAETIKSFFSEYVIETHPDIDSQIDEAFNFLDGEIVSYDEPFTRASGSYNRKSYGACTMNIITDKETEYRIDFMGQLTNDENPERIGVRCITIINMTESNKYANNDPKKEECKVYIGNPA